MKKIFVYILFSLISFNGLYSQSQTRINPSNDLSSYLTEGDSIPVITLPDIIIYPPYQFKNKDEEAQYRKLVRDVKKTLPYAKLIYATLIETYEYIETLPDKKSKEAHLKRMEKDLYEEYKPVLRKMSLSQGKLLIKLIDRECNQTSYDLVKAFLGSFRAGFWNVFAGMFGASLKSEYDPKGKDAKIEQVVILVEAGVI